MYKPTYYLWRNAFSSQEEFELERDKYIKSGFRVVTFFEDNNNQDINIGLKALIKNHTSCSYPLIHKYNYK